MSGLTSQVSPVTTILFLPVFFTIRSRKKREVAFLFMTEIDGTSAKSRGTHGRKASYETTKEPC